MTLTPFLRYFWSYFSLAPGSIQSSLKKLFQHYCKFQILGIKTTVGHYIIIFSRNSPCLYPWMELSIIPYRLRRQLSWHLQQGATTINIGVKGWEEQRARQCKYNVIPKMHKAGMYFSATCRLAATAGATIPVLGHVVCNAFVMCFCLLIST